jgi:predicted nucleic acid-binding protein
VLIVDASVALAWALPDERSAYADAALQHVAHHGAHVPDIWMLEIFNGLLMAERKKRITPRGADNFMTQMFELHSRGYLVVAGPPLDEIVHEVGLIAREQQLTAYDAAYLQLAKTSRIPIASFDAQLAAAAKSMGLSTWKPN